MTPLEFLKDEFENVDRVLKETLRHDYGPQRSREYYEECSTRLQVIQRTIKGISPTDASTIAAQMNELGVLASFISLVERSYRGEFSWPFAEAIRSIAERLLSERNLQGAVTGPIIHVVSDGRGYRIYNERLPTASSKRRLAVVFFPRSLKHNVLLHTIFGHELGHTAMFTNTAGKIIESEVMASFKSAGPLQDATACTAWLRDASAPVEIKTLIARHESKTKQKFGFTELSLAYWKTELFCDLFGLILFGPAFVAAHRTLLPPLLPTVFAFNPDASTHPPYAVRQKMLATALRLLGWDKPASNPADTSGIHEAEKELLKYVSEDSFPKWAAVFSDAQLTQAISIIDKIVRSAPSFGYHPPSDITLQMVASS
jgi:hypothetical protein